MFEAVTQFIDDNRKPTPSRYQFEFRGITDDGKPCVFRFDTYRLAEAVGIKSHPQFHAFKKIIRAGQSVKPLLQDIDESIACLHRWREMVIEDERKKNIYAD